MPDVLNTIEVLTGGLHTTIQDQGRYGFSSQGLSQGGPMDKHSFDLCNRLLDNPSDSACLEVTLGGLRLKTQGPTLICITGAKVELTVNGESKPTWQSVKVEANATIELSMAESGLRCYLGIKGGFQNPPMFGSRATVVREGIGPNDGRSLNSGDHLTYIPVAKTESDKRLPIPHEFSQNIELRVVTGYQADWFDSIELRRFFSEKYQVTNQIDRMGYRLNGPAIQCDSNKMYSEGIAFGAIQIPADGQPIVLLNDRQTLGGYPKIGSVFQLDLPLLTQCGSGATVRFKEISIEEAHNELLLAQRRSNLTEIEILEKAL